MIVVAYNCGYIGSGNHGDGDIGYHAQSYGRWKPH